MRSSISPKNGVAPGEIRSVMNESGEWASLMTPNDWLFDDLASTVKTALEPLPAKILKQGRCQRNVAAWRPLDFSLSPVGNARTADPQSAYADNDAAQTVGEADRKPAHADNNAAQTVDEKEGLDPEELQRKAMQIFERARREAAAKAEQESKDLIQSAQSILAETIAWRERVMAESSDQVVALIIRIAQKLFGNGIRLDPRALAEVYESALDEAKTCGSLRVLVNPQDKSRIGEAWVETQSKLRGQAIELVASDQILPGGCRIVGEFGEVDARVDTKIARLVEALQLGYSEVEKGT